MSLLNNFRVRGNTSPFGYRIYGQPMAGQSAPTSTVSLFANTIYCIPWLTGQGGQIDAIHQQFASPPAVRGNWGIYAAVHLRFVLPGGLLASNSVTMVNGVNSVALTHSATPNALHYLAFAVDTVAVSRRFLNARPLQSMLGCDSDGLRAHWGIAASYNVSAGLPTTFPQAGFELLTSASSIPPPFLGVHYA